MPPPLAAARINRLHRLWRALPARRRRSVMVRATALLAPRPMRAPPPPAGGIAVAGELARATGLGEVARLLLRGLDHLGVASWPIDTGDPIAGGARVAPALPPGAPLLLNVNAPLVPLALLRLPRGLARGRRVIGYWAWELPTVPDDWRVGAAFVHEAWVNSRFTAEALGPLLPGRVRVVTPPLAVAPPVPSALDRAAFGLPASAVVTLVSFNLASSLARKNPIAAIAAFRAAFGTRGDRVLMLKIGNPDDFPDDAAMLRDAVGGAPNIRVETRTLPDADRHALTACADIVLSLHRSEGFGLVPAEAMLLGRPVVATGWSGNMDFMDASSAALVGYRLIEARDPRGVFEAPGAVWADPDQGEAIAHLRRLADDPAARAQLGARGRAAATARLGTQSLAEAVASLGLAPS
jgi:glycosyltransferase involved in cell wall biosynthesis